MTTTIQLDVAKAYPNDVGRTIARLDPSILSQLGLGPNDIIEIEGHDTTVAKAWRIGRQDWNTKTVRLDGFTRQNADVRIGEPVELRPAEPATADSLALALPEVTPVQFSSDIHGGVKRQLLTRPVVERDFVPIMWDMNTDHPSMHSPTQAFPFIAVATDPNDVVLVTEETTVTIQEAAE